MGEMLVEIMRPKAGMQLFEPGEFVGPFPSGAPTIFIDTVARLKHSAGIFGGVGKDDFGKNILDRLKKDGVNTDYVFESENESTAVAFVTYFDAAFLCGLLDDKSLETCARMASAAGALNTLKLGPMEGDLSIENLKKLAGFE